MTTTGMSDMSQQASAFSELSECMNNESGPQDSGFRTLSTGVSLNSCGLGTDSTATQQQSSGQSGGGGPPAERGGGSAGGDGGGAGRRDPGGGASGGDGRRPPGSHSSADTDTDDSISDSDSEEEGAQVQTKAKQTFNVTVVLSDPPVPHQCTDHIILSPDLSPSSTLPLNIQPAGLNLRDRYSLTDFSESERPVHRDGVAVAVPLHPNPEPALNVRGILVRQEGIELEEVTYAYGTVDLSGHSADEEEPTQETMQLVQPIRAQQAGAQATGGSSRADVHQPQALQTRGGHLSVGDPLGISNKVRPPELRERAPANWQDQRYVATESGAVGGVNTIQNRSGRTNNEYGPAVEQRCNLCQTHKASELLHPCGHCLCAVCAWRYLDEDRDILQPCCPECGVSIRRRIRL